MSVGTLDTDRYLLVSHTRLSLFFAGLPIPFCYNSVMLISVRTPLLFPVSVWPLPRSLATTYGISVDVFSSPYLDVSVQAVPFVYLFDSVYDDRVLLCRVSPFGNPRVDGCFRLTVAYRRLLRPSSAPGAKAFPLRSF